MTAAGDAPFEGFRTGGLATTLPSQLFVELLPAIEDEAELRVTLYALYAIGRRRGSLRAVRASGLAAEEPLRRLLTRCGGDAALRPALEAAARRGGLLACPLDDGDALYFVNNDAGRRNRTRVQSGALEPGGTARTLPSSESPAAVGAPARVYEQEIGMLTPAVAAALAEAEQRYPEGWITDALRIAAQQNARSWRYAEAILVRWEAEGRDDEAAGRPAEGATRSGGKFEHLIRRS
jgi:DnaD/phage-associated family protein